MIDYIAFVSINFLALITPGPDFALITQYGLTGSRKAALSATLGIVCALCLQTAYCISGLSILSSLSDGGIFILKIGGSTYLLWLSFRIFQKSKLGIDQEKCLKAPFSTGFMTNLLNLQATLFLISLFGLFSQSLKNWSLKIAYAASIPLIALGWFSILSIFFSHPLFVEKIQQHRKKIMLLTAIFLFIMSSIGIITAINNYFNN